MFGWFTKKDVQLEAAKKRFLGAVYKESKRGGERKIFWIGRSKSGETIRIGVDFNGRTYFMNVERLKEMLDDETSGWSIVHPTAQ